LLENIRLILIFKRLLNHSQIAIVSERFVALKWMRNNVEESVCDVCDEVEISFVCNKNDRNDRYSNNLDSEYGSHISHISGELESC
jgi:hypothetical protein